MKQIICSTLVLAAALFALPASAQTQQEVGWCASATSTHDQTIAGCTAVIQSSKLDEKQLSEVLIIRAKAYWQKKLFDQGIADCSRAISLDATNDGAYSLRAFIYDDKGLRDQAIADLGRVLKLKPNDIDSLQFRAVLYGSNGSYDQAIADYTRLIELAPNDAYAYGLRAYTYHLKGEDARGLADAERALALAPKDAVNLGTRGMIYEKLGKRDKAIADYRASLAIDPANKEVVAGLKRLSVTQTGDRASSSAPVVAALPPPKGFTEPQGCVVLEPGQNSNGLWNAISHCPVTVSGNYCFEAGGATGCNTTPASFGVLKPGETKSIYGPDLKGHLPGETYSWRTSYCPHDEWLKGKCKVKPFR
ncbi:MAG: tetratricopeptide repeat protein [Hyphomonadaceae bacterium]